MRMYTQPINCCCDCPNIVRAYYHPPECGMTEAPIHDVDKINSDCPLTEAEQATPVSDREIEAQVAALTAERDALKADIATYRRTATEMQAFASGVTKAGQQAIAERDALQQRLDKMQSLNPQQHFDTWRQEQNRLCWIALLNSTGTTA